LKLRSEIFRVLRFGMVGAAATLTHSAVYLLIVTLTAIAPGIANVLAYFCALGVSLFGHSRVTFRVAVSYVRAAKIVAVSLLGLGLNAGFVWLVTALRYPPQFAVVFFVGVTPAVTYLALRALLAPRSDTASGTKRVP